MTFAGGSALAPIKAVVERTLSLDDHFALLCARHTILAFIPVLSQSSGTTERRTGFPHHALAVDIGDLDGCKAYLAGPPPVVEAATALLLERGMRHDDVHTDAFYTEAEKAGLEETP